MYKLTPRTTCTVMLEPGEIEEPFAGKPMLTPCAKHVVAKEASNAATVNFMSTSSSGDWRKHQRLFIYKIG